MSTNQELLKEIERQEVEANQELSSFKKVSKIEGILGILSLIISYLLVFLVVYLLFSKFNHNLNIFRKYWFEMATLSVYPGFIFIGLLMSILNKPTERLSYRLANTTKQKYDVATANLYSIRTSKENIAKQINEEENRIQRQKEAEEYRIRREKRDEEIRIQNELSKVKEWKFIDTINDAVNLVQSRKLSFEAASNLHTKLKEEYDLITYLYYHTNRYYDHRFYKIESALNRYDVKDTGGTSTPLKNNYNEIASGNKPEINPATNKVEAFTPNYIPVAKTEIPISKAASPTEPDRPIVKPEQPVVIVPPFIPSTDSKRERTFITFLNDSVYIIENRKISFIEAKRLHEELENEFKIIKSIGLALNTARYYDDRFQKILWALKNYEVQETPVSLTTDIENTDNDSLNKEQTETVPINPTNVKTDTTLVTGPDKPRAWWDPESKDAATTDKLATTASDKQIVKAETPIAKTESPRIQTEVPLISTDKPITKQLEIPILEANKSIDELFPEKKDSISGLPKQKRERQASKIDYLKLNEQRKKIGFLGEIFALDWEKKRLIKEELDAYIVHIKHVSKDDDSFGYDIESRNADGSLRYIEVKTTTGDESSPFFLTENEMTAMDNLNNYYIYRVYNFNVSTINGNLLDIDCDTELDMYFDISSVSYMVSPK